MDHIWYDLYGFVSEDGPRCGAGCCDLHGLDAFGGTQGRMSSAFKNRKYRACVFDIRVGMKDHDLTSRSGFETLFLMGLRLVAGAMVVLGPPCSMFVFLSSSQHKRHIYGPLGCPYDYATSMANMIAKNCVSE